MNQKQLISPISPLDLCTLLFGHHRRKQDIAYTSCTHGSFAISDFGWAQWGCCDPPLLLLLLCATVLCCAVCAVLLAG